MIETVCVQRAGLDGIQGSLFVCLYCFVNSIPAGHSMTSHDGDDKVMGKRLQGGSINWGHAGRGGGGGWGFALDSLLVGRGRFGQGSC